MNARTPSLIDRALETALPLSIHWDLTWRCDHKCVHCYLTERRQDELSFSEAEAVLDDLADVGVMMLLISGGDPFLRPDGIDIIRAARERSFDVRINTHGNFIDDQLADVLSDIGVSRVNISVYSDDPEEHEAVTLIKGSHAKSVAAAERADHRRHRLAARVAAVADQHRHEERELDLVLQQLAERLHDVRAHEEHAEEAEEPRGALA